MNRSLVLAFVVFAPTLALAQQSIDAPGRGYREQIMRLDNPPILYKVIEVKIPVANGGERPNSVPILIKKQFHTSPPSLPAGLLMLDPKQTWHPPSSEPEKMFDKPIRIFSDRLPSVPIKMPE